jgi:hypothetical protein
MHSRVCHKQPPVGRRYSAGSLNDQRPSIERGPQEIDQCSKNEPEESPVMPKYQAHPGDGDRQGADVKDRHALPTETGAQA